MLHDLSMAPHQARTLQFVGDVSISFMLPVKSSKPVCEFIVYDVAIYVEEKHLPFSSESMSLWSGSSELVTCLVFIMLFKVAA